MDAAKDYMVKMQWRDVRVGQIDPASINWSEIDFENIDEQDFADYDQ